MKSLVVYYSMTGNTERMADAIAGQLQVQGSTVDKFAVGDFAGNIDSYDIVLLGCPAMGAEVLEEMEFQPFYDDIKSSLVGKKVGLFGTYDWGDGQWMRDWTEDAIACGITLFEGEGVAVQQEDDIESAGIALAKGIAQ